MRCTGYEMARYKGTQASHLYEKSMHTLCTIQWATAPGRSLNYPRPKSITHLRTFSDNGVYVALQLFLVILVSDQWRRVLIPYSYRQAPWGLLHAQGWLSWYTWDQKLYVVSEPRETHSPTLKARFLHLTNLVAQPGIEPPTSWLPGQRVTTRPRPIVKPNRDIYKNAVFQHSHWTLHATPPSDCAVYSWPSYCPFRNLPGIFHPPQAHYNQFLIPRGGRQCYLIANLYS